MLTFARRKSSWLGRLNRDVQGATAIEYTLIASLIGIAIIAALGGLAAPLTDVFAAISAAFARV